MNDADIEHLLKKFLEEYLPDCAASVKRNCHMNKAKDAEPADVRGDLELVIAAVPAHRSGSSVISVLNALSESAKQYVRTLDGTPKASAFLDAAIVDYINFVGVKQCCDYAMYTVDLRA